MDHSQCWPVAIGFLSLSVNYFVQGGAMLFNRPKRPSDEAWTRNLGLRGSGALGLGGIKLGGCDQLLTGFILIIGLIWFPVFTNAGALCRPAVAFTVSGIHWIVLCGRRFRGPDRGPEAWMAIPILGPILGLSLPGLISCRLGGDWPVMVLFIGLSIIHVWDIVAGFSTNPLWLRVVAFFQLLTGIWLLYLTCAVTLNLANGLHLPV